MKTMWYEFESKILDYTSKERDMGCVRDETIIVLKRLPTLKTGDMWVKEQAENLKLLNKITTM